MTLNLSHIQHSISSLDQQQPDWQGLLNEILTAFECSTGTIHTLDASTGLLTIRAQRGIPDFLLPKMSIIPIGKGMAGIAAERREPVQICNLQTDESGVARPSAKETQVEGSIAVPLLLAGELYGVLGIAKPTAYEFSAEEISTLMQLGQSMAAFVAKKAAKKS